MRLTDLRVEPRLMPGFALLAAIGRGFGTAAGEVRSLARRSAQGALAGSGRLASLHAIAYASTAARDLSESVLDALVEDGRRRNLEAGITSLLLWCDGTFMHYLEGPRDAVADAIARIAASRWHYDVNVLMDEPIAEREFPLWALGFSRCLGVELLERVFAGDDGARPGPGRVMLRAFWRNCRSTAGPGGTC